MKFQVIKATFNYRGRIHKLTSRVFDKDYEMQRIECCKELLDQAKSDSIPLETLSDLTITDFPPTT